MWGSAAECHLLLLERQVYSVAKLCSDQIFLSLYHLRRVAGLSRLVKVNSNSNHLSVQRASNCFYARDRQFELRPQLIHWSLKYRDVQRPNLLCLSCRLRFECGMTFPTLGLTLKRWMGSRVQSTIECVPELCFLQFSVAQVIVELQKRFINNLVFPTCACVARFNNNNNNNNNNRITQCYFSNN